MTRIGFANIAQSPQNNIVPAILRFLPAHVEASERGILDGLTRTQISELSSDYEQPGIAAGLTDGDSVLLSHSKVLPLMQAAVDKLVDEERVNLVVILCGADWSSIRSTKIVINPGRLFPSIVSAISSDKKLGVMKPSASQVEKERKRYSELGVNAHVTSASPFVGAERLDFARTAAEDIKAAQCELVWMTCVAMDRQMKAIVQDITAKPVILAQELLALNISAMIGNTPIR